MHRFSGNKHIGCWWINTPTGYIYKSAAEIQNDPLVIWKPAKGSGEFDWPHMSINGEEKEFHYVE